MLMITDFTETFGGLFLTAMFALYIMRSMYVRSANRSGLPPGPKRVPFLGNVHQIPRTDQHITFMQWATQYGDVVYAEFFGKPMVILSSVKAVNDLLEKRSAKYSSRPYLRYYLDLVGWTGNVALAPYGETWRRWRKWFQKGFIARTAANSYHPIQCREVRRLLYDLLQKPDDFVFALKRYTAAIVLDIGYGHRVTSLEDDKFIRLVEDGLEKSLEGSGAGSAFVDFFPILVDIPAWMPGMGWKYWAMIARKAVKAMEDIPYDVVKSDVAAGTARPSFTASLIEELSRKGTFMEKDECDIKGAAGTLYAAGTGTSLASMIVFILVMVQCPAVFEKAQDEMARVVGDTRLPVFEDRESLPYLECIIREVYRWCPPVATSVPRQTQEDDVYRGYYIPKGSTIVTNLWAIFRDPNMYPEPDTFKPERFLNKDEDDAFDIKDPKKIVFGAGRRVCPGRYFADDNIWLAAASIVATMAIRKARSENGEEILPTLKFLSGTVMTPEPFVCEIRPRSQKTLQLILDSVVQL
ncbi:cytochrome P450 [Daedalea quercina L-15889]|uniref:Cytochrome P450 n=1 Tax=Daedalea quercina L-15889 TaxID=1314783 RepID=A0A165QF08_9APHY|nr:cytochrome P450 [Daedalea quercina L-15889]